MKSRYSEGVGGMGAVTKPARGSCLKELMCPDVAKQVQDMGDTDFCWAGERLLSGTNVTNSSQGDVRVLPPLQYWFLSFAGPPPISFIVYFLLA